MEALKPYRVEYTNDSYACIDVYITVPGRKSRLIDDPRKNMYREVIKPRAFEESIHYYGSVPAYLNHDREIASKEDVEVYEDSIGLRAIIKTQDIETLAKILSGHIIGCSFVFKCLNEEIENYLFENLRTVNKLKLTEVSLIDESKLPVYNASSIQIVTIPNSLVNSISEYRLKLLKK